MSLNVRPREVHAAIVDPRSKRRFASVTWVDGVGHLVRLTFPYYLHLGKKKLLYRLLTYFTYSYNLQVPQEVPDKLAGIIFKILAKNEKGEVRVRL